MANRVAKGKVSYHAVAVSAPFPLLDEISSIGEFGNYRVGGALSDIESGGDVAEARLRMAGEVHQRARMFSEKPPATHGREH